MSGSGSADTSPEAAQVQGGLRLPVMGNAMKYINPMYTQAQTDNSLSPLAAYQAYQQNGVMPQQQSAYQPFTAPTMPTIGVDTSVQAPKSAFAGLFSRRYEDDEAQTKQPTKAQTMFGLLGKR